MVPDALRDRILGAVDARQDEIITFSQRPIQIESVTGHEGAGQDYMAGELKRMGLTVDWFEPDPAALRDHPAHSPVEGLDFRGRPNVVGICRGSGGGNSFLFNGHVDTTPLEPIQAWTHGLLSGAVHEGKIFGRGAADMKGGLASMPWR